MKNPFCFVTMRTSLFIFGSYFKTILPSLLVGISTLNGCHQPSKINHFKKSHTSTGQVDINISEQLKNNLKGVKTYLELLSNPGLVQDRLKLHGIYVLRDENNKIIPGMLRYSTSKNSNGPKAAILGGIHMNEMSGVFALKLFHERWIKGVRPQTGTIFIATGQIKRALEFIDLVLRSKTIDPTIWASYRVTADNFNFNRIPYNILDKKLDNDFEIRAHNIIKYVLDPAEGAVLDIHNTSTDTDPMITLFMKKGENAEQSMSRLKLSGATKDLPIRNFIFWKPGPYNNMHSIRCTGKQSEGKLPILLEAGAGANPESFDIANQFIQIWLNNVMGMVPQKSVRRAFEVGKQHVYLETDALYHPAVKPNDFLQLSTDEIKNAKKDTFVIIRGPNSIRRDDWSAKARLVLSGLDIQSLTKDRLDNFKPIKRGEIIALGLKTGLKFVARQDAYVLMVGSSRVIESTFNETFANLGKLVSFANN